VAEGFLGLKTAMSWHSLDGVYSSQAQTKYTTENRHLEIKKQDAGSHIHYLILWHRPLGIHECFL